MAESSDALYSSSFYSLLMSMRESRVAVLVAAAIDSDLGLG